MLTCPDDPTLICTADTACTIEDRCWFLNDIHLVELIAAAKAAKEAAAKEARR